MTFPDNIFHEFSEKPENRREYVLTGIPPSYTVSATPETGSSEVDKLMIRNFLNTLAEIAIAIASREANER